MQTADQTPEQSEQGLLVDINVTPFIDVMLVLLIVFMVTAPLLVAGVPLKLPTTSAAALQPQAQPIVISMDEKGELFIGDCTVRESSLEAELARLVREKPSRPIHVRCDRTLDYGRVLEMLAQVGRAGAAQVSLISGEGRKNTTRDVQ